MTFIMTFFALTGLDWPVGLVLYWCTTTIWTLGQQYILGLRYPYTPPAPVESDAPAKPGSRTATANALTAGSARGQRTNGKVTGARGAANGTANGASAGNSVLRRLSKSKSEPEPPPAEPDVKLVRHQTQRQSRSKRSGKR